MRVILTTLIIMAFLSISAKADYHPFNWAVEKEVPKHHEYRHPFHHYAKKHRRKHFVVKHPVIKHPIVKKIEKDVPNGNLVRVQTLAGPIVVAAAYAERFVGFINALVTEGHKPKDVGCFAPHGHMRNSKHHWGGACDIDQRDRNKTAGYMYHVTSLAHEYQLTDGCEFSHPDCGHVEVPSNNIRTAHIHHRHLKHYAKA